MMLLTGPKSQVPRQWATSMPRGIIDAEISPTTSIRPGRVGTIAGKIRTSAPTQLISGMITPFQPVGSECHIRPRARALATRYPSPRSRMNWGLRFDFLV